jgi:hypothetical protein
MDRGTNRQTGGQMDRQTDKRTDGWMVSLTPLLSNLAVSTTNTVNLMFNSTKMAEATN